MANSMVSRALRSMGINQEAKEQDSASGTRQKVEVRFGRNKESNISQTNLQDYSSEIFVARNIKYIEDGGQTMKKIIKRIEGGQAVIVDFSGLDESKRTRAFDVLYGATVAYDGEYVILDENYNYMMFTKTKKIEDEHKISLEK